MYVVRKILPRGSRVYTGFQMELQGIYFNLPAAFYILFSRLPLKTLKTKMTLLTFSDRIRYDEKAK